jgi:lipopolysaccharide cholinephosphotransferase
MEKLKNFLKTKGAILEYGNFYLSYRNQLITILNYYQKKGYKVAIWGAGLKGTAFLNCIDVKGNYINTVIDMNKQLYGTNITLKHKVSSLEDALNSNPNVMMIMNSDHYADNLSLLREKEFKGIVIDLDNVIENRIDPNQIIEGKCYEIKNCPNYDLTKIHLQILDILKEIDRICKKYNITYFLSAGTALGAIRHKGFIPWDDDADIGMLREDFDRFRQIVEPEMGKSFYYQRMKKGSGFYRAFDQIGKKNTSFVIYNVKDLKIHHGIHVDIFPFDYVSKDVIKREEHVKEVQLYRQKLYQKLVPHVVTTKSRMKQIIINHEYYSMKLTPFQYLNKKMESALQRYKDVDEEYVADLLTHYKKIMYFKKSDIIPVKYVDFEDMQLPIPNKAPVYLEMMYGDYMTPPPEGKRNQRHRIVELSYDEEYFKDKLMFEEKVK